MEREPVKVVDVGRRRFLTATTTAMGGVGAVLTAVPFVKSMNPSARVQAAALPTVVDVGELQPGRMAVVKWRGRPVWIVRRTPETIAGLREAAPWLLDPDSQESRQPASCQNPTRSIRDEYFVALGICTHLGCAPTFRPEIAPPDLGAEWRGGFFCPCHGSRFDLAGRVYAGVPAPRNLDIPPYHYSGDAQLVIGVDQGEA